MRKKQSKQNKQKKSILFSTAVVALGCIISAIYANRSLSDSQDYKVDLSELDFENKESADGNSFNNAAGSETAQDELNANGDMLASVNGKEMIDRFPTIDTTAREETRKAERTSDYLSEQADMTNEVIGPRQDSNEDSDEKNNEENSDTQKETSQLESDNQKEVASLNADLNFQPDDKMTWPVLGDVILNYSMDGDVYFETLQQYKYNPAIYVGAKEGDAVSACAKGQVIEIGQDARIGQYVVMDLGNGYQATYGQLGNLQVKKGSVVARGQVIANVAKTTRYFSVEGDHVYLAITKDGKPVNPMDFLE